MTRSNKYLSLWIGLIFTGMSLTSVAQNAQNDKAYMLAYYEKTAHALTEHVQGLSKDQLQYKPSAKEWSISQCLEHIIQVEAALFGMTAEMLKGEAKPERRKEITMTDEDLIKQITDRSFKAEAPAEMQPAGSYMDADEALEDFRAGRKVITDFLQDVELSDLRDHIEDSPFGPADSYQSFLFIAGHTARHIAQIEEVKASEGFPSK